MKAYCFALLLVSVTSSLSAASDTPDGVPPDRALQILMQGNQRFASGARRHPDESLGRRHELSNGQKPFAVILSCADSRVPPEHIFDQGLGDLFVIRVAGNIADDAVLGSIEYAVEHLGAKLIMVLGHQKCGAVQAAVAEGTPPGHLKALVDAIRPAIPKENHEVDAVVRANVRLVVKEILEDEPIREGTGIKVVGARYDLDSGKVEVLK